LNNKISKKLTNIFIKNTNNKLKTVPFNLNINHVGETKYFPAVSKEWRNEVYFYNNTFVTNFPVYNLNINKIIKSYFNLYFNNKFLSKNYIRKKLKHLSLNRIYVSKPELKHTNHKIIITIYIFNKEILSFIDLFKRLKRKIYYFILKRYFLYQIILKKRKSLVSSKYISNNENKFFYRTILKFRFKISKLFRLIRKYKLYFNLNKYKFEDIFLYKLSKLIGRSFNKKVEFNIINLHSIILHADLFTEFLKLKLKSKRKAKVRKAMNIVLNRIDLPKEKIVKGKLTKSVNFGLLENKYNSLNVNSLTNNNNNLYKRLRELYNNILLNKALVSYNHSIVNKNKNKLNKIIENRKNKLKINMFDLIKYKNLRGIRLEVKGRLTWRYRADRSLYKVLWKGGLKNVDSSFKSLSAVTFRGYANSNVEYSMHISKRRIGAFAVKGWISGGK
jgi:hypothetical protein